ncbi:DUF6160 family protein [Alcanivorax sp. NBRC 102024]|uniref:DUF6160 family protein n=1 Tax=Alcanivorax sp. NBRC 102024 TaxID=1113895 RepID=UPI000ACB50AB|nr:DUF6160 family protein [Alcanivorax sp. NBRC 102024]
MKALILLCMQLISSATLAAGLQSLDDATMSNVTGQAGIAVDLELRINTDENFNPLSNLDYCDGPSNDCRMAFNFHNRNSGGGEWIVWKDLYGTLKINDLRIDAGQTSGNPSGFQDDIANNRFISGTGGGCLLDENLTAEDCYQGALGIPMLSLTFNEDIELFLNIGAVAVEYGPEGYLQDAQSAALGLRIADTGTDGTISDNGFSYGNIHPATIKIGGSMGLYGF